MLYLLLAQQHITEERGSPALFRKQIQLFHGAFLSANKKAKGLADKHLAMYAEGVLFDYCDALFAFLKRPLEYFQKPRYNNYRIVKLDSWLIAW